MESKHELEKVKFGVIPITVYRGCLVTKLVGGFEIFNTKDKEYWNSVPVTDYDHNEISVRDKKADIWSPFDETVGPHFNLSIDLNACTGCGAS